MRGASRSLTTWLDNNAALSSSGATHRVHESLLAATDLAHWKTVYSTVVRHGEWPKLDYAHQLSHGARRMATQLIEPKLAGFKSIAKNLIDDQQFADAHDLVRQAVRVVDDEFDAIVRTSHLVGESIQTDELGEDHAFWQKCSTESGRGYRDRINAHNRHWFEHDHKGEAEKRVIEIIAHKWKEAVEGVRSLLVQE
jgi:hypothetical protein